MKFSVISSSYNQLAFIPTMMAKLNGQTFKDFEWIVADDGSSDGTLEFLDRQNIKYVTQPDKGYRLVEILNKAAKVAQGDYLVWIMMDSWPKDDFLEQLDKLVKPDRMVNGVRININDQGKIISTDWRVPLVKMTPEGKVISDLPWRMMTLNGMCMPRKAYKRMGGIYKGYKGYGQMDWDMSAWCVYNGIELWWQDLAILYHRDHPEREDTPKNIEVFAKRLFEMQQGVNGYT